jgi:hypothetical protein
MFPVRYGQTHRPFSVADSPTSPRKERTVQAQTVTAFPFVTSCKVFFSIGEDALSIPQRRQATFCLLILLTTLTVIKGISTTFPTSRHAVWTTDMNSLRGTDMCTLGSVN